MCVCPVCALCVWVWVGLGLCGCHWLELGVKIWVHLPPWHHAAYHVAPLCVHVHVRQGRQLKLHVGGIFLREETGPWGVPAPEITNSAYYKLVYICAGAGRVGMRPYTTTRRCSALLRAHGGRGRRCLRAGPWGVPCNVQNHIFGLCIEYVLTGVARVGWYAPTYHHQA